MARTPRAESGVRNSAPDPGNPPDPADPAEMASGAAVKTLPNHAQESQDDVSSQANSLKLNLQVIKRILGANYQEFPG